MKKLNSFIIADDNPIELFLHAKIVSELGYSVVGLATSGEELIELCRAKRTDYILSDTIMPKVDGFNACRIVKKEYPEIKAICATSFNDLTFPIKLRNNGFDAYLLKGFNSFKLSKVISQLSMKSFVIDPILSKDIIKHLKPIKSQLSELSELSEFFKIEHNGIEFKITDRHILLVSAIYHSLRREEISNLMNIAPDTVDQNIKRFKQKLGVDTKMELVKLFIEWGLIVNLKK